MSKNTIYRSGNLTLKAGDLSRYMKERTRLFRKMDPVQEPPATTAHAPGKNEGAAFVSHVKSNSDTRRPAFDPAYVSDGSALCDIVNSLPRPSTPSPDFYFLVGNKVGEIPDKPGERKVSIE